MKPRVTIVLPSYNRYPFNALCLRALEKQTVDLSTMQVILVDDASTDETRRLRHYRPPYPYQYVRNERVLGVARSRNVGLKRAKGDVLVFLDADMIPEPNYVKFQLEWYRHDERSVVLAGTEGSKLYSVLVPGMKRGQIRQIVKLYRERDIVRERIDGALNGGERMDDGQLRSALRSLKRPIPLLSANELDDSIRMNAFSTPKSTKVNLLAAALGRRLRDSPIAWMGCPGNLAVGRRLLRTVGGYDPDFVGWGTEDVDLAYRLYRAGARFVVDDRVKRYHQEHAPPPNKKVEWQKNKMLLLKKHPVLEVAVRSLNEVGAFDYALVDRIVREAYALRRRSPAEFAKFEAASVAMLHEILRLKSKGRRPNRLLERSRIAARKRRRLKGVRNRMEATGEFPHLVKLYDFLVSL
ncbi:glycosyltransferase [Paenibacillus antri]|uniref:Glycosyltransferase n=1 Tax=Paenibacillus antri TaxID=2582848 RepID=A0A5R9GA36_9BACL|nr:glycosyltransferase family 2 protein [Paenibacillus antri]TLS51226.1 glycosyltransferase [Paenibacillus antri]